MRITDTLSMAFTAIGGSKIRSLLTTLGIVIGVGSVVLMLSIGASFQAYILGQLDGIGSGVIDVYPKGLEQFARRNDTINLADAEAISRLSTISSMSPVIIVPSEVTSDNKKATPLVIGAYPNFSVNYGIEIDLGRSLTLDDNKAARSLAVIGPETAMDLFNTTNVIGERIRIQSRTFTIVGVNKSKGSLTGQDLDTMVAIPFSTAKALTGQNFVNYVTLTTTGDIDLAIADVKSLLRQRHGISNPTDDPDKDDFLARSTEQATDILGTVTLSLTAFLVLVAGISLLVGGIGIMNIMLVSVSERTKEIGLRKAVGATSGDVLWQFLIEAVVLTLAGGLIGIVSGIGIAYIVSIIANSYLGDFPFAVSYVAITLATSMAIGVGLVFGIIPAKKAANLSPMEAMRSE